MSSRSSSCARGRAQSCPHLPDCRTTPESEVSATAEQVMQTEPYESAPVYYTPTDERPDLFNQPNVKGWDGGNNWLTSQLFLQRQNASDFLCNGRMLNRKVLRGNDMETSEMIKTIKVGITFKKGSNKEIISELTERLLFQNNLDLQKDMEQVLKYDFDASSENAEKAVLRLFNYITKTPEYQLI